MLVFCLHDLDWFLCAPQQRMHLTWAAPLPTLSIFSIHMSISQGALQIHYSICMGPTFPCTFSSWLPVASFLVQVWEEIVSCWLLSTFSISFMILQLCCILHETSLSKTKTYWLMKWFLTQNLLYYSIPLPALLWKFSSSAICII